MTDSQRPPKTTDHGIVHNQNISSKLRSGAIISFTARYADLFIQLGITALLSRLLSPSEFGVIAVVMVLVVFFAIFSEAGLGAAVVQEGNLSRDDISTLFNLSLLLGVSLGLLFFFSGGVIAAFYSNPVYKDIVRWLSLTLFFSSLNIVPQALLRKRQRFALHGMLQITSSALSGILAVIFAWQGKSYYSLVYKSVFSSALFFFLCAFAAKLPVSRVFLYGTVRRVASFSLFQFLFNFINYFSRNLDKLLVGRYLGMAPLGYYEKSYRLMMLPLQSFTFALSPILHPILAEYRDTPDAIYHAYLRISRLMAFLGFPLSVFLAYSSKEIILIIFGQQWLESVPVFQILSFSVGIQMVLSLTGSIFQSAGRTDLLFVSGFLSAVIMVSGTILGIVYHSLNVLAWGLVAAFAFNFLQGHYFLIRKALRAELFPFYRQLFVPVLSALILAGVLFFVQLLISNFSENIVFGLTVKTLVFCTYMIVVSIITGDAKSFILSQKRGRQANSVK